MLQSILQKSKALLGVGILVEKTADSLENNNVDLSKTEITKDDDNVKINEELLKETVYDHIRTIRDPEKPATLEDLHVVEEDCIKIESVIGSEIYTIFVEFNPTVPHCSLATLIGLCIRVKLERSLNEKFKLDIYLKKGTHTTEDEINKQINDKERIAAAMENPNLREIVESCILDSE